MTEEFFIQPAKEIVEEVVEAGPSVSVWDFVKDLGQKKNYIFSEETEKEYKPYIINHAFSSHLDSVLYAQEMNERYNVPKEANFAFHYYSFPKYRAFKKGWAKKSSELDEKIQMLKEYLNYSEIRCRELIPLVDELNLWESIKNEIERGGVNKKSSPKKDK